MVRSGVVWYGVYFGALWCGVQCCVVMCMQYLESSMMSSYSIYMLTCMILYLVLPCIVFAWHCICSV